MFDHCGQRHAPPTCNLTWYSLCGPACIRLPLSSTSSISTFLPGRWWQGASDEGRTSRKGREILAVDSNAFLPVQTERSHRCDVLCFNGMGMT